MTLQAPYTPSSASAIDFFCRNAAAQWWNGTAYEDFNVANYATYRIAATESPADSGLYEAAQPSGAVVFELRLRAGTWAGSVIVAGPEKTDSAQSAALLDEFKADAELGTGAGGAANADEVKSRVRAGLSGRWTNHGTAPGRDDISVGDIP